MNGYGCGLCGGRWPTLHGFHGHQAAGECVQAVRASTTTPDLIRRRAKHAARSTRKTPADT